MVTATGTCGICGAEFDYTAEGVQLPGGKSIAIPRRTCELPACRSEQARREAAVEQARTANQDTEAWREHAEHVRHPVTGVPKMFWAPMMPDGVTPNQSLALADHIPAWARSWNRYQSMFLHGGAGIGKTHLLAALLLHQIPLGVTIAWYDTRTLIARAQSSIRRKDIPRPAILDEPCGVDICVLSDFGVERPTEYAIEQIALVVHERYAAQLPVLMDSNFDMATLVDRPEDDMDKLAVERIMSRMTEMTEQRPGIHRHMQGEDRRTQ